MRLIAAFLLIGATRLFGQDVEWRYYAGDAGGSHYSPLTEINRGNVTALQQAWTYRTGALEPETPLNEKAAFESAPLMIARTLYVTTPFSELIALDANRGTEKWRFDPRVDRSQNYSEVTSRGVAAFIDSREPARCALRLFLGTIDGRLFAIDGTTGSPCLDFGTNGVVGLADTVPNLRCGQFQITSPPVVAGDTVVVGSSIGDNGRVDVERGTVRAFDVRTGAMRWSFDPLGREISNTRSGAANAWAVMAADEKRGLVFIPTSSPSPDYFGGLRPGSNAFANSVVAIEAASGRVVWHFQVVHHDLWDYDVASQPNLITFRKGQRDIDAIAITTKMGNLFILDRSTGKPLIGVEERQVTPSDIPGEIASPTQPFTANPPLVPQGPIGPDDAWGPTQEERDWCRQYISRFKSGGIYTPPTLEGTIVNPGNVGGVAWGGASYDPRRRRLFVNTNRLPVVVRLIPRAAFDAERQRARDNRMEGEFATQRGAPFGMYRDPLLGPSRLPCIAPPWGTLTAVDTDTGSKVWEVPLGKIGDGQVKGLLSLGGSLVTAGDLLFIAATIGEDALRAFDIETGVLLWQVPLPAGGQATPMTYRVDGKQYVVFAAGGHGKANTPRGDYVIAYALP